MTLREVVASDADALAHVLIAANEHAFRGRVPDVCLKFSEAESSANWRRTLEEGLPVGDFIVVAATAAGKVVGFAWGGANMKGTLYAGELRQLAVLPAYQRQGIGRQLVCYVVQRLVETQLIYSMRVEVLHVNPNRAFYERLGGKFVSEHPYDWDGVSLTMDTYGWMDTSKLLADHCR
jgi:ribosomal protein S18 acetylase RimI-like enzyme